MLFLDFFWIFSSIIVPLQFMFESSFFLFIKLYFVYKVQGPSDQFFIFVVEDQGHDHLHHGDRDRGRGEVG